MDALLDTGSFYCLMAWEVADALGLDPHAEPRDAIWRGSELVEGALHRHPVRIPALPGQGKDLLAEPLWFVSAEWDRPPVVLGWTGFLSAVSAFGCDPGRDADDQPRFLFASP
jgi:hypothetical protein